MRVWRNCKAVAAGLQSSCGGIARPLWRNCKVVVAELQGGCGRIANWVRRDCKAVVAAWQSGCGGVAKAKGWKGISFGCKQQEML